MVDAGQDIDIAGIEIADVDALESSPLSVELSVGNGLLRLVTTDGISVTAGNASGDSALVISGTAAALNAALGTLTYRGDDAFGGIETLDILVNDQGNTGSGGSLTATAELSFEVTPAGILLRENSDFVVVAEEVVSIPETPTVLQFSYTDFFDTTETFAINDAFEVALLDADGRSLVHTYGVGQDAFFNVSEGLPVAQAAGVSVDGQTVSVDLSDIAAGTEARLVFRLVNNDGDTQTAVRISGIALSPGEDNGVLSATPVSRLEAPNQAVNFNKIGRAHV